MDTLKDNPLLEKSVITQLLALAAIAQGGELRFEMDDLKTLMQTPEDGWVMIDLDKINQQVVVKTVRKTFGGENN